MKRLALITLVLLFSQSAHSFTAAERYLMVQSSAPSVPGAPSGGSLVSGNGSITLHPGTSGGATSYKYYRTNDGSTPTKSHYDATATVTDGQTISSLTNGTRYKVIYTAVNAQGESSESSIYNTVPALFYDNFYASDGSAPDATKWGSLVTGGAAAYTGSTADIRSNQFKFHVASNDGTNRYTQVKSLNTVSLDSGNTIEATFTIPTLGTGLPQVDPLIFGNWAGTDLFELVIIGNGVNNARIDSYDSDSVLTSSINFTVSTNATHTVKISLSGGSLNFYLDGSSIISNWPHTVTLPVTSNIGFDYQTLSASTGVFYDTTVSEFIFY